MVSAEESSDCGVFYANQVIGNSCGSVAVVNAVSPLRVLWPARRSSSDLVHQQVMNITPQDSSNEKETIAHGVSQFADSIAYLDADV